MDSYDDLNLPQWEGTSLKPRAGILERTATNGMVRLRALQSETKYDPTVVHGMVSPAQLTAFKAFYELNRTRVFEFTAAEDGVLREVVFSSKAFDVTPINGMFKLTVYMMEV